MALGCVAAGAVALSPGGPAALEAFVPLLIRRRLERDPRPPTAPWAERFPAAVLSADVVGFTSLTERLARSGPQGAERVKELLDLCFGRLTELLWEHGGESFKFAGDAALALWPVAEEESLAETVRRAAACGPAIQRALDGIAALEGERLRLRVGIAAGQVWAASLGGIEGRWESLVAGEPLEEAAAAQALARPGEVVLSASAQGLAGDTLVSEPLSPRPAAGVALSTDCAAALHAYVPRTVRGHVEAGQTEWLAEFRRVSAMFASARGLDFSRSDALERADALVRAFQGSVYERGGSVTQVVAEGQGVTLIAGWGLSLRSYEDDAVRAVRSALACRDEWRRLGLEGSFGVATGRVFTGTRGGPRRVEYAMIGDAVNLAARLMQHADGEVLCDGTTRAAAEKRLAFEALQPVSLKGRAQPVPVHKPLGEKVDLGPQRGGLVGRREEARLLAEEVRALADGGKGALVLVEGEAGMGKSRLISRLLAEADALGVPAWVGAGEALQELAPYFAWRGIFRRLLGLDGLAEERARRERVLGRLAPALHERAPLLAPLLDLELPESEVIAKMTAQARADATRELLIDLLRGVLGAAPAVIVLEDAHWLDSASWSLAEAVQREVAPLLLVVSTRPLGEPYPTAECRRLLEQPGTRRLRLTPLAAEDALDLVCQRLGVPAIPEALARLILDKAEGHPFFSEQLALALLDLGAVQIVDGECRWSGAGLDSLQVPDDIRGVIVGRLDRLSPRQQLILKVASVFGRSFELRALRSVYPVVEDRSALAEHIASISQADLIEPEPEGRYNFKHALTRDTAYELLPFAHRRQLHGSLAEWYELEHQTNLAAVYGLLAHHWSQAEVSGKAVDYLEKAGEQASRSGSFREVGSFLERALGFAAPAAVPVARQARWKRQLGQTYYLLGRFAESRAKVEEALGDLGQPVPASRAALALGLVRQALIQAAHRFRPRRVAGRASSEARRTFLEASLAFQAAAPLYYLAQATGLTFYACLRSLNLAERAEPAPVRALGYSSLQFVSGALGMRGLAEGYRRRAMEIAERLDEPSTLAEILYNSGVYHAGTGEWQAAAEEAHRAVEICRPRGEHLTRRNAMGLASFVLHHRGDFSESRRRGAEVAEECREAGDLVRLIWGLSDVGSALACAGRLDEAMAELERALELAREPSSEIAIRGQLALVELRRGDSGRARALADEAFAQLVDLGALPMMVTMERGFSGIAAVYLELWRRDGDRSAGSEDILERRVRRICSTLARFSRAFPFAQPARWLCQGSYESRRARPRRALAAWRRALAHAVRLGMPYEEAQAHFQLGTSLPREDPARSVHLGKAAEIFARLDAGYDLAAVRQELAREA